MNRSAHESSSRKRSLVLAMALCLGLVGLAIWLQAPPGAGPGFSKGQQGGADPGAPGWVQRGALWHLAGRTMGTSFTVSLRDADPEDLTEVKAAIDQRLQAVNAAMSTYQKDSEISQFNRLPAGASQRLSSDFAKVLDYSLDLARRSDGAFDPTVGPLVRAWGFGAGAGEQDHAPSQSKLAELLTRVGYGKLKYDAATRMLGKSASVELDLSAVAKGFGVDAVFGMLQARGYQNLMVEIGGEVCVAGQPEAGRAWRIGVEAPSLDEASPRTVLKMVDLSDACMATSGDYRSYLALDGEKRQHTIDPRSGQSVRNGLSSVSVIAEHCMQADAVATAMMVMGPRQAPVFGKALGVDHMMIVREDAKPLRVVPSKGFSSRTVSP